MTPERVQVRAGGRDHTVLVQQPAGGAPGRTPLLLLLHGSGGNAEVALEMSGLHEVATAAGYLLAAPQATTPMDTGSAHPAGGWAWSVPGVPLLDGTQASDVDDVTNLLNLADSLGARFDTDPRAMYLAGFSGGARMACAVTAAAPDRVAGLGVVAGLRAGRATGAEWRTPDTATLAPGRPVPVIAFHGTDDPVNPMAGDGLPRWGYSVEDAARAWASRNRVPVVAESSRTAPHVVRHRYGAGSPGEVQLHVVEGGGHTWPGGAPGSPLLGTPTQEISASTLLCEFFADTARLRSSPADRGSVSRERRSGGAG